MKLQYLKTNLVLHLKWSAVVVGIEIRYTRHYKPQLVYEILKSEFRGQRPFFDFLMSAHFGTHIQCSVYHTAPVNK